LPAVEAVVLTTTIKLVEVELVVLDQQLLQLVAVAHLKLL
jgi:hypothetical protein